VKLLRPTLVDLLTLCRDARPDEIEQYEALRGVEWDVDEIANDLYSRSGVKFSVFTDAGELVVCGGWQHATPGVMSSWMVGTMATWERHWRVIQRASRRVMDSLLEHDAHRLQTIALAKRTAACKWYEDGLLMEREGVLRNFGANGEDAVIYSRVRAVEPVVYVEAA
jgi:hypothetical protein